MKNYNFCSNCGNKIEEGYVYCIKCGTKFEEKKFNYKRILTFCGIIILILVLCYSTYLGISSYSNYAKERDGYFLGIEWNLTQEKLRTKNKNLSDLSPIMSNVFIEYVDEFYGIKVDDCKVYYNFSAKTNRFYSGMAIMNYNEKTEKNIIEKFNTLFKITCEDKGIMKIWETKYSTIKMFKNDNNNQLTVYFETNSNDEI